MPLGPGEAHPTRYVAVSPRNRPKRKRFFGEQMLSKLAAPAVGSPLLFPRRFDAAVERLRRGGARHAIHPRHADWYFGSLLRFELDPERLQERISDVVRAEGAFHWVGASFLDGADWTRALAPIERSPIHREMSDLVAADLDFRSIPAYRALLQASELGQPVRRNGKVLAGVEQIDAYFRYCADLIASIRANGVVPQQRLGAVRRRWLAHWNARPPGLSSTERDVGIAIGRNGEVLRHLGGKHRTAVAQALRLPSMPVELRLVHVGWIATEMQRTGLPAHKALREALRTKDRFA